MCVGVRVQVVQCRCGGVGVNGVYCDIKLNITHCTMYMYMYVLHILTMYMYVCIFCCAICTSSYVDSKSTVLQNVVSIISITLL